MPEYFMNSVLMNSCIRGNCERCSYARAHARWIIAADSMEIFHFSREGRYHRGRFIQYRDSRWGSDTTCRSKEMTLTKLKIILLVMKSLLFYRPLRELWWMHESICKIFTSQTLANLKNNKSEIYKSVLISKNDSF